MDIKTALGANVKRLRIQANMTQENLADNSNVTYEAINRLERGKSWPKLETVENIRAALGCRYSELFDFSDLDEKTA